MPSALSAIEPSSFGSTAPTAVNYVRAGLETSSSPASMSRHSHVEDRLLHDTVAPPLEFAHTRAKSFPVEQQLSLAASFAYPVRSAVPPSPSSAPTERAQLASVRVRPAAMERVKGRPTTKEGAPEKPCGSFLLVRDAGSDCAEDVGWGHLAEACASFTG